MGKLYLRKFQRSNSKWTDKDSERHKHDFSVHCIVRLVGDENKHIGVWEYNAIKCKYCNSFREAKFIGFNDKVDESLPVLIFNKNRFLMGFNGIKFVRFIER